MVKESSEVLEGVPCIEGLDVSGAELYQSLENGDEAVFQSILEVTQQVREFELSPNRIVCSNGDIQLWFGEICVLLGDNITSDKMAQISPILANLEGVKARFTWNIFRRKGTLSLLISMSCQRQRRPRRHRKRSSLRWHPGNRMPEPTDTADKMPCFSRKNERKSIKIEKILLIFCTKAYII